ncbi:hypothetical protein CY0110_15967 [Crocosphaera chwakensis CCY0110]|uniref:Uncharacterized protein n=1 Tax=Crocosphaera chwakensis CCY0110 TaxID=391612 RepID=A3IHM5_9CHRO|nr:hypothetical protein CY0110_15967 [Crocosphaera chwakensis CCY0110]
MGRGSARKIGGRVKTRTAYP